MLFSLGGSFISEIVSNIFIPVNRKHYIFVWSFLPITRYSVFVFFILVPCSYLLFYFCSTFPNFILYFLILPTIDFSCLHHYCTIFLYLVSKNSNSLFAISSFGYLARYSENFVLAVEKSDIYSYAEASLNNSSCITSPSPVAIPF